MAQSEQTTVSDIENNPVAQDILAKIEVDQKMDCRFRRTSGQHYVGKSRTRRKTCLGKQRLV